MDAQIKIGTIEGKNYERLIEYLGQALTEAVDRGQNNVADTIAKAMQSLSGPHYTNINNSHFEHRE